MNLNQWKYVLIAIFLSVLFFVIILPIMSDNLSRIEDKFLTIALLNESSNIGNYFSNEESNVNINESITWNIYLYNHMGELQYISIRIKIVSDINDLPNISLCSPSPMPEIFEIRRFISDNQTIIVPLTWSITDANDSGVGLNISKMNINGHKVDVNLADIFDKKVSIVIELWVWDNETNDFTFQWISSHENRCSWNHVSFTNKFTPVVSNPIPINGATEVPTNITQLEFTIDEPNEEKMDYYVSTVPDVGFDSATDVFDGTYSLRVSGLNYETEYLLWVNVTDGLYWTNASYSFTTEPNSSPIIENIEPNDGATNVTMSTTLLNFTLSDPNGDLMNYFVSMIPDVGFDSATYVSDGTFSLDISGLAIGHNYTWWVNVTEGTSWTNMSYPFTTENSLSFVSARTRNSKILAFKTMVLN